MTFTRAIAALALVIAPVAAGAMASAAGFAPAGPTGDCDWVDEAAVAELPATEATASLEELTTMSAALDVADLAEQLDEEGPLTIFAPSNDAFDDIPVNVFDSIVADPVLLASILKYHIVVGDSLSAEDLGSEVSVETLNGPLGVTRDGETLVLNGGDAVVTCAGIRTADATIYVIDHVLQPASLETGTDGNSIPGSSLPGSSVPGSTPSATVGSIPETLVGQYRQIRRLDTSTEEIRVLVFYADATYEFWIQPLNYYERGHVIADLETIEFLATTPVDPDWTFSGRGPARWTLDVACCGPGLELTFEFSDGRGYNEDGLDKGTDVYFPCEQTDSCLPLSMSSDPRGAREDFAPLAGS